MIGEFLYQLTAKDVISQPVLQRVTLLNGAAAAAVNVDISFPAVPGDRVFWVTHCQSAVIPGAGQIGQRLEWNVIDSVGNNLLSGPAITFNPALAAAQIASHSWTTELLLMPGEVLRARGVFSAGGVANTLSAAAFGIFLPKGNLQLR